MSEVIFLIKILIKKLILVITLKIYNVESWFLQGNHHWIDDILRCNQHLRLKVDNLAYKFQNKQFVFEGPYYKYFFHPYMQATTMFFGEFMMLGVFFLLKSRNPEKFKMSMLDARSKGK